MATEAWVALFIAITIPLVGFAWANMQSRIAKVERDAGDRITRIEEALRKEMNDKHVDLRHMIKNVNTQLGEMLIKDNREASAQMLKSIELTMQLLKGPASDEILARRSIKGSDRA